MLLLLSSVISSRHPTYCSRLVALKKYIVFSWLLFVKKIILWPQLLGVQLNPRKDILPSGKKIGGNYSFAKKGALVLDYIKIWAKL